MEFDALFHAALCYIKLTLDVSLTTCTCFFVDRHVGIFHNLALVDGDMMPSLSRGVCSMLSSSLSGFFSGIV